MGHPKLENTRATCATRDKNLLIFGTGQDFYGSLYS